MIIRDQWGYRVALARPDGTECVRRFAGLGAAQKWRAAVWALGVIPEGKPVYAFFKGGPVRSVPLRDPAGVGCYDLAEAESLALLMYPGLVADLVQ